MQPGCYTAMITPFTNGGVDNDGLDRLVEFQIAGGITGILAVGTTGESPTLSWDEHDAIVERVAAGTRNKCACIAGAGSNNTAEALVAAKHALASGVDAVLLVDPYYNGPSSLEIRREYVEPIAKALPDAEIIPYVIPGRTGCQLLPQDLAICHQGFGNIRTVKEATGNLDNMRLTRACCGNDFTILSGDDGMTFEMMTDPAIAGAGVISVVSNIAPAAMTRLVTLLAEGYHEEARVLKQDLEPLFNLVTVSTEEQTAHGQVLCRARNPLGLKTLMNVMGMPAGICRPPLGKMTRQGVKYVVDIARQVHGANPGILKPAQEFFDLDLDRRLNDPTAWEGLYYEEY